MGFLGYGDFMAIFHTHYPVATQYMFNNQYDMYFSDLFINRDSKK